VNWLLDRDEQDRLRFASLQSEQGRALLLKHGLDPNAIDTIVVVEGDHCYTRSTAILHVAKRLGLPWGLASAFLIIPRPIRDYAYSTIAKSRYRLFGKLDQCRIPTPNIRKKFLD
jgi:predicted DCC family thiol-disulfide oxidoreductase YuxK